MGVRRAEGHGWMGRTSDGMAEALKRGRRSGHVACDAAEESHVVEIVDVMKLKGGKRANNCET